LAEVRKFLEQQGLKDQYEYLTFHCDWAVHAQLRGRTAQRVLKHFDEANIHLRSGLDLEQLPKSLQQEIDRISKLAYFEQELTGFLQMHNLPDLSAKRPDGWPHFVHLYAKIVEDCPLVMSADNKTATIDKVTLRFELAKQPLEHEMFYKMTWEVLDKNGLTGDLFILNSFSLKPH
jgi:hypothetical protein